MTDGAKVLLLADTHVPTRARDLPAQLWRAIETADVVLHAGAWVSLDPGSPTDRRRQPFASYLTLTVRSGSLRDIRLHRLPQR